MFSELRQILRDLATGAIPVAQRREVLGEMRATLAQAKLGLADLGVALEKTRKELTFERQQLETVRRRKDMAAAIGDRETVDVASRFEEKHAERVAILGRKQGAQEDEFALADSEIGAMLTELKAVAAGAGSGLSPDPVAREVAETLDEAETLRRDIDAIARTRIRESRQADAEARLTDLKRKMRRTEP
jgi:hypothetical protein